MYTLKHAIYLILKKIDTEIIFQIILKFIYNEFDRLTLSAKRRTVTASGILEC